MGSSTVKVAPLIFRTRLGAAVKLPLNVPAAEKPGSAPSPNTAWTLAVIWFALDVPSVAVVLICMNMELDGHFSVFEVQELDRSIVVFVKSSTELACQSVSVAVMFQAQTPFVCVIEPAKSAGLRLSPLTGVQTPVPLPLSVADQLAASV